jgi:hypothetical protein
LSVFVLASWHGRGSSVTGGSATGVLITGGSQWRSGDRDNLACPIADILVKIAQHREIVNNSNQTTADCKGRRPYSSPNQCRRRCSAFSANLIQSPASRSQASLSIWLADLSANLRHSSASWRNLSASVSAMATEIMHKSELKAHGCLLLQFLDSEGEFYLHHRAMIVADLNRHLLV